MRGMLLLGFACIVFGCAEAVAIALTSRRRSMIAQAIAFIEVGLAFVFLDVFSGPATLASGSLPGVGALVSFGVQFKLLRQESRDHGVRPNHA